MTRKGLFQPALLGFFLAGGFLVLWLAASMAIFTVWESITVRGEPYEWLMFLQDGTAVIQKVDRARQSEYRDLDGNLLPASRVLGKEAGYGARLPASPPAPETHPLGSWEDSIRVFSDGSRPVVYWYFISNGRSPPRGYFVGYDSESNARVGYLGTAGFRAEPVPTEEHIPFSGTVTAQPGGLLSLQRTYHEVVYPSAGEGGQGVSGSVGPWDVYLLGHDHKAYHVDLRQRTVEVVLENPELRTLELSNYGYNAGPKTPCRLLARSGDAVLVLDEHGRLLQRYPIPEPLLDRSFSFLLIGKDEAVMTGDERSPGGGRPEVSVWWVSPRGVVRQRDVIQGRAGGDLPPALVGIACPCPLVLASSAGTFGAWVQMHMGKAASYSEGLGIAVRLMWGAFLISLAVAAPLAVLCYRHQVRYGASSGERLLWTLFVLALGLPGWLAYRFGCSWPPLQRCPTCGAAVPGDREHCARCAAEFPKPALKGTEVFA